MGLEIGDWRFQSAECRAGIDKVYDKGWRQSGGQSERRFSWLLVSYDWEAVAAAVDYVSDAAVSIARIHQLLASNYEGLIDGDAFGVINLRLGMGWADFFVIGRLPAFSLDPGRLHAEESTRVDGAVCFGAGHNSGPPVGCILEDRFDPFGQLVERFAIA